MNRPNTLREAIERTDTILIGAGAGFVRRRRRQSLRPGFR